MFERDVAPSLRRLREHLTALPAERRSAAEREIVRLEHLVFLSERLCDRFRRAIAERELETASLRFALDRNAADREISGGIE